MGSGEKGIVDTNKNEICFFAGAVPPETSQGLDFHFFFNRDMSLREVKSNNSTDRIHNKLVARGKLTGKIDSTYLANLKNGVRYWDRKEWRKDVVRVQHSQFTVQR